MAATTAYSLQSIDHKLYVRFQQPVNYKEDMNDFVLAFDQGTTSSRAIVFDHNGIPVASAQKEFKQHFPQPGWVEHDPEEIWSTQAGVAMETIKKAGLKSADIADKMLKRFAAGELSMLKEFLFNTAIDVRVIEDQTPFNKAVEKVSSRELLEASRATGHICTSFDDKGHRLMVHLFYQEQGTELQNSLLANQSAALLAVTHAALGVDMRGLIVLSEENLLLGTNDDESAAAEECNQNKTED